MSRSALSLSIVGAAWVLGGLISMVAVAAPEVGPASQPSVVSSLPPHEHEAGDAYFTCPMHPEVHEHAPGRCPLCKMKLVERRVLAPTREPAQAKPQAKPRETPQRPATPLAQPTATTTPSPAGAPPDPTPPATMSPMAGDDEVAHYTCPMHPSVKQHQPGECPICGMDLIPVSRGELRTGVVVVDGPRRQSLGIRTAPVERQALAKTVRALGRVVVDESRIVDVTLLTHGWIEGLKADRTGQVVEQGQTLAFVYSPEVVAAQDELLLALRAQKSADREAVAARSGAMIRAARGKLLSLGLAEWQIDAVVNAGKSSRRFAVVAPHRGYLVEKDVVEGAHIQANSRLFRIVPLDRVWIDADVYVRDLPLVARGQTVTASVPSWAGDHARTGTIDFVYPEVEAKTQTGRVRVVLGNKDGSLLPGMYVDVDVEVPLPEALTVPVDAVLYSGEHRLVFKDLGEGRLTPVPIVIGDRSGDRVVVRSGLSEGEVVVTSGAFLIAAESRLKSAAPYWGGRLDHAGETTVGGGHGAH